MLTIQNIDILKNKTISYPYYVKGITPVILYEPMTFNSLSSYHIELTNNKETLLMKLQREIDETGYGYELRMGTKAVVLRIDDIKGLGTFMLWMEHLINENKSVTI